MNEKEENYVEKILNFYQGKENSKVEELKELDRKVKLPAVVFAYGFGIVGALVLGFGMCLAMEVLFDLMPLGIGIGIVGILMVSVNYFFYEKILKSRKNKYADQIIELSRGILHE